MWLFMLDVTVVVTWRELWTRYVFIHSFVGWLVGWLVRSFIQDPSFWDIVKANRFSLTAITPRRKLWRSPYVLGKSLTILAKLTTLISQWQPWENAFWFLFHSILFCSFLFSSLLFSSLLFSSRLFYSILFYSILCCPLKILSLKGKITRLFSGYRKRRLCTALEEGGVRIPK